MDREYSSFLLRRWRLTDGGERFEIEHIQSQVKGLARSLSEALRWIEAFEPAGGSDAIGQSRLDGAAPPDPAPADSQPLSRRPKG